MITDRNYVAMCMETTAQHLGCNEQVKSMALMESKECVFLLTLKA